MLRKAGIVMLPLVMLSFLVSTFGQGLPQKPGVEVWLDKDCYVEGEFLTFHVRAERDSYLVVVDLSPDGKAAILFPNSYVREVFVRAGRTYELPEFGSPVKIRVSTPASASPSARERIWVVASEKPLDIPASISGSTEEVVRKVRDAVDSLPFGAWWAAAVAEFSYGPCGMAAPPAQGVERKIEELNRAITAAGAEWKAGFTPLSLLSFDELRQRCGVTNEPVDPARSLTFPPYGVHKGLPSLLDWRDLNGDWTTPVKDQGPCGSCWIFGPVAVFEALLDISSQDPRNDPQDILSEQYVLSYIQAGKGCHGGPPAKAMEFLVDRGTVTASCFPYTHSDKHLDSYQVGCLTQKLFDWGGMEGDLSREPPKPVPVEKIKQAIYTYGPVTAAMAIYEDFAHYKGGIYRHVKGKLVGYHMVLIVGWEDGTRSWICKNSWGPLWGMGGWFQIKWGDSSIGYMVLAGMTEYTAFYIKKYGSLYEYVSKVLAETSP